MTFAFFIKIMNEQKNGFKESRNLEHYLKIICKEFDIELRDASSYNSVGIITDIVNQALEAADIVFAEATSSNENVWYEIGYADRVNPQKVLVVVNAERKLPFDRSHIKTFVLDQSDAHKVEEFQRTIRLAVNEILGTAAVRKILLGENPEERVPEYIHRRPAIRKNAIDLLKRTSIDVENSGEIRRRAIRVLAKMGDVDDSQLAMQTERIVDATVRSEVFDVIAGIDRAISPDVWANAYAAQKSVPVMRSAAIAGASHFARGLLSREVFQKNFIRHPRWEVKKHATITLLKHIDSDEFNGDVDIIDELLSSRLDEVLNRFSEWLIALADTSLNDSQKKILAHMREFLDSNSEISAKKIRKNLEQLSID